MGREETEIKQTRGRGGGGRVVRDPSGCLADIGPHKGWRWQQWQQWQREEEEEEGRLDIGSNRTGLGSDVCGGWQLTCVTWRHRSHMVGSTTGKGAACCVLRMMRTLQHDSHGVCVVPVWESSSEPSQRRQLDLSSDGCSGSAHPNTCRDVIPCTPPPAGCPTTPSPPQLPHRVAHTERRRVKVGGLVAP